MTIKKTLSVKRPTELAPAHAAGESVAPSANPASAAIADRFKLDASDAPKAKKSDGVGAIVALCAGVAALVVAGILTFVMYQHWTFLQGA